MKKVILIIVVFVLIISVGLMTYMLSDGNSILGFNLRAANENESQDPFLADLEVVPTTEPTVEPVASSDNSVIPTDDPSLVNDSPAQVNPEADSDVDPNLLAYNSTSPTVTPGGMPLGLVTPDISITPSGTGPSVSPLPKGGVLVLTLTPTLTPTVTPEPSPTVITELPETGITDHVDKILIGGGILILLAFLF